MKQQSPPSFAKANQLISTSASMISFDKLLQTFMNIAIMLLFTGVYQMFVYDGKAKGCSGEHFDKYRDTMEIEQIVRIIGKECGSYKTAFKTWKYLTLTSVAVFIGSGLYCVVKQKEAI